MRRSGARSKPLTRALHARTVPAAACRSVWTSRAVSITSAIPGPRRQPQRRGGVGARAGRRAFGRPAELHRRRRGGGRGGGGARRAADRELAVRPGRRDARPALRGAALDRPRGDAADLALRSSASPGASLDEARTLRSHPAAFDQCRDLLGATRAFGVHPGGDDGRRGARGGRAGDPRQAAIASAEAAARFGLDVLARRRRRPHGVHPLRRARAVHAGRRAARAGARRCRSSPTTSPARSTARSGRSRGTTSTSCSSCRGRSRTRRCATASTSCSTATCSTSTSARRLREMRELTRELRLFGCYPAETLSGEHALPQDLGRARRRRGGRASRRSSTSTCTSCTR